MNNVSKRLASDLLTLVIHAKRDLSYEEGGSYGISDEDMDSKSAKEALRAIEYLERKFISQHYVV